jgi:hypothetical protein
MSEKDDEDDEDEYETSEKCVCNDEIQIGRVNGQKSGTFYDAL